MTEVYTPEGKGKIVYELPDKTVLVQFPHGGGQVYRPGQLVDPTRYVRKANPRGLRVA